MKKLYFLTLLLALGFVVAACTPQAQQEATSALTDQTGENMEKEGDAIMDDDKMMDDGDAMKDDGAMMDDDKMMDDGDKMMDDDKAMMDDGDAMAGETKVFNVGGVNFAFDATEIRVKKGDTVTINFTSNGGFHDFVVDEFGAATDRVNAGGSSSVTFVADKAGTFEYYCSVGSHRALGMVGNLIVE